MNSTHPSALSPDLNFGISIPNPCHEDWSKMTPDQKGAYCKVCSKSVHDFTEKSPEQIRSILVNEMAAGAKVCGRFNPDQLVDLKEDTAGTIHLGYNFRRLRRTALALALVFGSYLFNSFKVSAQKMGKIAVSCRLPLKGELVAVESPRPLTQTTAADTIIIKHTEADPDEVIGQALIGDVMIEPGAAGQTPPVEPYILPDTTEEFLEPVVGMIAIEMPETADTISSEVTGLLPVTDPVTEFSIPESTLVNDPEPMIEIIKEDKSTALLPEQPKLICFPNPTSDGQITLKYSTPKDGFISIRIMDVQGHYMKTLLELPRIYKADYETRYDISDLPDGVYFCELISGAERTTSRIVLTK